MRTDEVKEGSSRHRDSSTKDPRSASAFDCREEEDGKDSMVLKGSDGEGTVYSPCFVLDCERDL